MLTHPRSHVLADTKPNTRTAQTGEPKNGLRGGRGTAGVDEHTSRIITSAASTLSCRARIHILVNGLPPKKAQQHVWHERRPPNPPKMVRDHEQGDAENGFRAQLFAPTRVLASTSRCVVVCVDDFSAHWQPRCAELCPCGFKEAVRLAAVIRWLRGRLGGEVPESGRQEVCRELNVSATQTRQDSGKWRLDVGFLRKSPRTQQREKRFSPTGRQVQVTRYSHHQRMAQARPDQVVLVRALSQRMAAPTDGAEPCSCYFSPHPGRNLLYPHGHWILRCVSGLTTIGAGHVHSGSLYRWLTQAQTVGPRETSHFPRMVWVDQRFDVGV